MAFRCAKFLRAIFRRNAAQIADATPRAAPQHHFNAWLVGALSPPLVTRDGAQLLRRRSSAATPTVSPHEFHDLSVGARILAEGGGGAACGLVLPLIFTPMELVKVRRQVMHDDAATSWELARAAWREGGVAAADATARTNHPNTRLNLLASTILSRLAKLLSRWLQPTPSSSFSPPPY